MLRAMARIEAVVFDFGNVLTMVDRLACCRALGRHTTLSAENIAARIWGGEIERLSETGVWDSLEHFHRIRDAIGAQADWGHVQFLEEFAAGFVINPEGVEAMRLARRMGRRVFVLSNCSYNHARFLFHQEDLVRIPEGHVFSFKVGVMKPDPLIWRHLLETRCLAPERCLYIDDIAAFCRAAEALGLRSIHYVKGKTDLLGDIGRALGI